MLNKLFSILDVSNGCHNNRTSTIMWQTLLIDVLIIHSIMVDVTIVMILFTTFLG